MKVILTQDVKNIGRQGDVVEVKEGYGRNFLIPRGLAVAADAGSMRRLKHEKAVARTKEVRELEEAKELKAKVDAMSVTLKVKTGDKGRLFGSITASDVAEELAKQGVQVDRRRIEIAEPIKNLGTYKFPVRIHAGVVAELTVIVAAE